VTAIDDARLAGSVRNTARALREQRVTARELLEACLAQVDAHQARTNAFIEVDWAGARAAADISDRELRQGHDRGVLHGIPMSLKDLLDQEGHVTTAGSRSMTRVADADAPAVAHLRLHGAVFVGRTNMHEFAMGTTSEDSGFGPVRHPHDPAHVPGGSTGGGAVAAATGMCHVSIGSDTGGSIRIPSACCGLVGLKPAWGEVSLAGVVPLSPTCDCIGPLARSVEDAWWTLQALKTSGPLPAPPAARRLADVRIGVLRAFGWATVDPQVGEPVTQVLARLAAAGARVEDAELAAAALVAPAYGTIVIREALDYHLPRLPEHAEAYTPAVRTRLQTATRPPDAEYEAALEARARVEADVASQLARVDVLALPSLPITPPRLGQTHVAWPHGEELTRAAMLRLTQPFNLSRHPAIALPIARTTDGWPVSLQLVGRDSASLVAVASSVEATLRESATL
jgi:aspartyl-tRNA(Asn)/glutamyl-tRNA(Gln) amidotransferase subunit A